MNPGQPVKSIEEQIEALLPADRIELTSWLLTHYDQGGNLMPQPPMDVDEWKTWLDAVQALEAFYLSA
jgi:L-ascorbate metabolism protein UlaG (beta-lactamase superfamily)